MRLRIFIILLILLTLAAGTSCAQQVDPLSGRLNYSVSLGSIQANDLAVSVSIHTQGGALQVAEGAGTCGMGWSLSAGGSITRQVRGLPDEFGAGWKAGAGIAAAVNSFSPVADDDLTNCTDVNETTDYNAIVSMAGHDLNPIKDTEPDMFYVNAPGLSAQFVFGTDGLPKLLTHQILKFDLGLFPNSITITNAQGMVYYFNTEETVIRKGTTESSTDQVNTMSRYYANETTFTGKWHLYSITSSVTGTVAVFNYTSLPQARNIDYLSSDSLNYITDIIVPKRLSSVTIKTFTLTLEWLNNLLSKVIISESETLDRQEFTLEYVTVASDNFYKSFLFKMRQVNNCVPSSTLEFEYKDVTAGQQVGMRWKYNNQQDYFGYYNGVTDNKNSPTLYLYTGEVNGKRLRATPIPNGSPTVIAGDDRSVISTLSGFGALTKIKYPTGGYIQIDYQPNRYFDGSTSEEFDGGGVRVWKITRQGSEVAFGKTLDVTSTYRAIKTEYVYTLANGTSSGVLLSPVKLGYIASTGVVKSITGLGEEPAILYTRVTEIVAGQGKRVYEYSVPGVFPDIAAGEWSAARSRVARMPTPCLSTGNVANGYYLFPYAPSSNNTKRGLLTKVSEFSEAGVPVRDRTESTVERTSSPATIKALRFERINNIYHYAQYQILTGRVEVPYQTIVRESSESNPGLWMQTTTTYTYNSNNMMSQVATTLPDGTVKRQYMKYVNDFPITAPLSTDTMAVAIKKLWDQHRLTQPIEQISTVTLPGQTETTESASLTLFREFSSNRVLPAYSLAAYPAAVITAASSTATTFTKDTDYRTAGMYKAYDLEGRLQAQQDDKHNNTGYHYAVNTSTPTMAIAMARGQQCIYEGFEQLGSFGLTPSGPTSTTDSWTGEKAIQFGNGTDKVASSVTNMIQKGGAAYRMSCWVKAATNKAVTFTVRQGATSLSGVLTVTANNTYAYLEGSVNVSSFSGPFTLEVTTNAAAGSPVIVDDIVFVPSHARISIQTAKLFKGVTYATDDRGNSIKNKYDEGGRLLTTCDKDRNLVRKNEYLSKDAMTPGVNAMFSTSATSYEAGQVITFTAGTSCASTNVVRTWYVDNVAQVIAAPATSLMLTYDAPGTHVVKLVVNDLLYGASEFAQTICVEPGIGITVEKLDSNGNPYIGPIDCNFLGTITFTAKQPSFWYRGTYSSVLNSWSWDLVSEPYVPVISIDFYEPASTTLKALPDLTGSGACMFSSYD